MHKSVVCSIAISCMLLSGCLGSGTVSFEGTAISGPVAGDFTLTDQDGNNVTLSDYKGDVVVIMFIFTRCPDVCPVTTQNLDSVADELGSGMNGVTFLSVSVDPEYDTPERLKAFTQKHGVNWPHLTGSFEDSEAVWENFGIVVDKQFIEAHVGEYDNSSSDEEMNHVMVLYPDNSTESLAMLNSDLGENATGWDLTNQSFINANLSFNYTENDGIHTINRINSTSANENQSWSLFLWNSSSSIWEQSFDSVANITLTNTTNIAWATNNSDPSLIPSPIHNENEENSEECNGHGYVMGSGPGAHCMCDEGYSWAEGDKLSCVPNDDGHDHDEDSSNYSVGHTTVMYILDKGQHKRVVWTGDSWNPSKVASDIRILLDESGNDHSHDH